MTTEIALFQKMAVTKVIYRSRAGRHFYGTENEIWTGFGPIGLLKKKDWGPIMDYVRRGEIQGRYLVFFKAQGPVFYHV